MARGTLVVWVVVAGAGAEDAGVGTVESVTEFAGSEEIHLGDESTGSCLMCVVNVGVIVIVCCCCC